MLPKKPPLSVKAENGANSTLGVSGQKMIFGAFVGKSKHAQAKLGKAATCSSPKITPSGSSTEVPCVGVGSMDTSFAPSVGPVPIHVPSPPLRNSTDIPLSVGKDPKSTGQARTLRFESFQSRRVGHQLRDARAAVQAPRTFRPDTPYELLAKAQRPSAPRGARLPSLPQPTQHATSSGPALADGRFAAAMPQPHRFHPDRFLLSFQQAIESPQDGVRRQVGLLRELALWLANPLHKIQVEWVQMFTQRLDLYNEQDQLNEDDLSVIVAMSSILLRNTVPQTCLALPSTVLLLRCMAEGGRCAWIEREILFEPLLHLLQDEPLLRQQPRTLLAITEIFLSATTAPSDEDAGSSQSNAGTISSQLVVLGIVPVLNTLLQRVLDLEAATAKAVAADALVWHAIMSTVCGIYRNLSAGYICHLREVGTMELLLCVLEVAAAHTVVVAAASRALVKFVFDVDCLRALRGNNRLISAAATALTHQISIHKSSAASSPKGREWGDESEVPYLLLLVSRLCSVIGIAVQGSTSHREYLVQNYARLLEELVNQFVACSLHREPGSCTTPQISEGAGGEMTVVQGVVWLVGLAAMSPHSSLEFVMQVSSMLVQYLKELELTPATRLNAIYVLMCISNLSCHFHRMEDDNKSSDVLLKLFSTLGLVLAGFLFEGDAEATVEATRVLGNVSYTSAGRDWMEANRCDEVVVIFTGHEDLRIAYNCFGILLNLTAATSCRVVEDPQLLKMLLQHTDRYTRRTDIDKAAAEEVSRLRQGLGGDSHAANDLASSLSNLRDADSSATSMDAVEVLAKDYAEQTADLVEKLLMNVQGLLLCAASDGAVEPHSES